MSDIVEKLIIVLEDLYGREQITDVIGNKLQGYEDSLPSGPGSLFKQISDLELIIIEYLGGNKSHNVYCREVEKEEDPFYNLNKGNISRGEF